VQHALRAFTAKDQKAVKAAAETFRANPDFRVEQAITELAVGEALVSMLEDKGTPGIVQRTLIAPPASRVGPALPSERQAVFAASPMAGRYDIAIDRESAYEQLRARAETLAPREAAEPAAPASAPRPRARGGKSPASFAEAFANNAARSIGSKLGREIVRGVLGSLFRGR
jgi:DNA helicase HerA-like ATPase